MLEPKRLPVREDCAISQRSCGGKPNSARSETVSAAGREAASGLASIVLSVAYVCKVPTRWRVGKRGNGIANSHLLVGGSCDQSGTVNSGDGSRTQLERCNGGHPSSSLGQEHGFGQMHRVPRRQSQRQVRSLRHRNGLHELSRDPG